MRWARLRQFALSTASLYFLTTWREHKYSTTRRRSTRHRRPFGQQSLRPQRRAACDPCSVKHTKRPETGAHRKPFARSLSKLASSLALMSSYTWLVEQPSEDETRSAHVLRFLCAQCVSPGRMTACGELGLPRCGTMPSSYGRGASVVSATGSCKPEKSFATAASSPLSPIIAS